MLPNLVPKTIASRGMLLLLASLLLSGCAQLDLGDDFEWLGIEEKPRVPDRMICMWTDTIRHKPSETTMRGFGGRIMFYSKTERKPVKVDGTVNVYVFADQGQDPKHSVPEKKFVFLPEQVPLHHSESDLGHSYSFFLPWDAVGGPQEQLTLIVRFEATTGQVVMSDASRKTLPGRIDTAVVRTSPPVPLPDRVRQVSHQMPVTRPTPVNMMKTDTIDVPPNFAQAGTSFAPEAMTPSASAVGAWQTQVSYQRPAGLGNPAAGSSSPTAGSASTLATAVPRVDSGRRRYRVPRATRAQPRFSRGSRQPVPPASPSVPTPTPSVPTPPVQASPQAAWPVLPPWPPAAGG